MKKIKVGIIGATGYAGIELVRLLSLHPHTQLTALSSVSYEGKKISEVYPNLKGICEDTLQNEDIIDKCDVIFTSLTHGLSEKFAGKCLAKGVKMIDAPVSGGEPKAVDGSLSIMVGGPEEVFREVYDILMVMGGSAVHCGAIGAGNTTKLANQVIVALNIAAVSEAFMLSTKAGVDPNKVFAAIKGGLAGSTVMNAKVPMITAGNFKPGFKIDLHIKDLNNALETGHGVGAPLPLTASVMEILQNLHMDGCGQEDHSAIAKYYEKLAGCQIRCEEE